MLCMCKMCAIAKLFEMIKRTLFDIFIHETESIFSLHNAEFINNVTQAAHTKWALSVLFSLYASYSENSFHNIAYHVFIVDGVKCLFRIRNE